jgi:thioredoxin-dependent peroxiredoxin
LRSFQSHLPEFESRGIHVAAICVDSPEANHDHRQKLGLTFPLLSDEKREVVRRYDLLHEKGGPDGTDISRPAELLIDPTGTVHWANFTESVTVRARPARVLAAFDASIVPK